MAPMKVAVSWSGGKDGALAALRAREAGHEVAWLLNLVDPVTGRDRAHGLREDILQAQAEACGIPIVQREASIEHYEAVFRQAVGELREAGLEGVVFGDIDFAPHREWGERVCGDLRVEALYPLWDLPHEAVVAEVLAWDLRAMVVAARRDLGRPWLGRFLDNAFVDDLHDHPDVSPAGEGGEFHTLVVGGPMFRRPLAYRLGEIFDLDGHVAVDVLVDEPVEEE